MWPQEKRTRLGRKKSVILTGLREGISACYAGPQGKTSEWRQKTEVLREFRSQPLLGFLWERQGWLNNLRLASLINLGRI